jgi:phage terminase small subunit
VSIAPIKSPRQTRPRPPAHLQPTTAQWFNEVIAAYQLETHHVRLLQMACESWDRCQQAREVLDRDGLTFTDRLGNPRARAECAVERDSRIAFSRLLRELDLDIEPPPPSSRPPSLRSNRRT